MPNIDEGNPRKYIYFTYCPQYRQKGTNNEWSAIRGPFSTLVKADAFIKEYLNLPALEYLEWSILQQQIEETITDTILPIE